jgi:hypothetical protein
VVYPRRTRSIWCRTSCTTTHRFLTGRHLGFLMGLCRQG